MKVFASKYLEHMSTDSVPNSAEWSWTPENGNIDNIYACGANTSTRTSTYAAEKDDRSDSDRPNEGLYVA